MDTISKIMYNGRYPCHKNNKWYIYLTFYLEKDIENESTILNALKPLFQFKRFKFIPHYNMWTGIYDFLPPPGIQWLYDIDQTLKQHIHQYYHVTHSQCQTKINEIANEPLNYELAWWDIHIIHLQNDTDHENIVHAMNTFECIILLRYHHVIGDGITFIKNIAPKLFSNKNGESISEHLDSIYAKLKESKTRNINNNNNSFCFVFDRIIDALWSITTEQTKTVPLIPMFETMKCKFGQQILYHHTIPLYKLNKIHSELNENEFIKNKFNINHHISYNDIIMAISSGASRKIIFQNNNEKYITSINKKQNENDFKCDMNVLSVVAPYKAFIANNTKSFELKNEWSLISTPYFINIADNIDRIIHTSKALQPIKHPWTISVITAMRGKLTHLLSDVSQFVLKRLQENHLFVYSMLRSPINNDNNNDNDIYFCNIKINDISVHVGDMFYCHMHEMLMFGNKLSINLTVGQNGQQYAQQFCQQFENIVNDTHIELSNIISNAYASVESITIDSQ